MLSQLPDELLESGLNATTSESPFTQFLGAIEMTKRVQQRKSAKQTLDGQRGQDGTVVGRIIQQREQIKDAQAAPSFMTGGPVKGEIPPQFRPGYQSKGLDQSAPSAPSAPSPRRSVTKQHQSTGGGGQNVTQSQLALSRAPQKLAEGGIVEAGPEIEGYLTGGIVRGGVTPRERARREEERRQAYLRERGLPVTPQEVIAPEAPLEGPQMSFEPTFDAEAYEASSRSMGAPAGNRSQMIGVDNLQGYRNPLQRMQDATGLFQGTAGFTPEPIQARPESDWGSAGPPPMSIGAPAELPIQHSAPSPTAREYGAIPDEELAQMQKQLETDKVNLALDTATAEAVGETDEQRSARFTRATALATMAASFGSESTFFKGLTKGVEGAAQVMQAGDQTARDREFDQEQLGQRQMSSNEMLALKARGLRNDMAQGVAGTDIKMKKLALDAVYKDVENGIGEIPETQEAMDKLVAAKLTMLFGQLQQPAPSPGAAVLATKNQ